MEKVKKLKKVLLREKIDGYLIPKNDEFFDEYIPSYNDRLRYISNYSGSYGYSLILKKKKLLVCRWEVYITSKRSKQKII